MNIKPQDIEISLVPSDHEHNLGNWSMQTYSGVVLYHKPTGIQVRCTEHKSQWKNKAAAMEKLLVKVEDYRSSDIKLDLIKQILDDNKLSGCECPETISLQALHTLLQIKVVVND
ncbi:RF-1 domain peptide chain release factor [Vibrio phage K460]